MNDVFETQGLSPQDVSCSGRDKARPSMGEQTNILRSTCGRLENKKVKNAFPKPDWLKQKLPQGQAYEEVRAMLKQGHLHTVYRSAKCQNAWECFSQHTATLLILEDVCTRNCNFFAVSHGAPAQLNHDDPAKVAAAVKEMRLNYAVITSVTRDDLPEHKDKNFNP